MSAYLSVTERNILKSSIMLAYFFYVHMHMHIFEDMSLAVYIFKII